MGREGEFHHSKGEEVSDRTLPDPKLEFFAVGCNTCDWRSNQKAPRLGFVPFGIHNNEKHTDTPSAHMTYIYKKIK